MADEDAYFKEDVQRIQKGYKMLDDIERKLKGYLSTGTDSSQAQSNGFE